MRVVAGSAKGRPLVAPVGTSTRPTSDRVREALFNALHSLGAIEGASVLDRFAGSGALGIEALSRGAASCTFVDDDPKAIDAIRRNLERTAVEGAEVLRRGTTPPGHFDLVLLDPPYKTPDEVWHEVLAGLDAGLVVTESDRELDLGPRWETLRSKRYGSTVVQIAEMTTKGSA
jgi:16S rRNA (guanine966-N2)-methyltransferase